MAKRSTIRANSTKAAKLNALAAADAQTALDEYFDEHQLWLFGEGTERRGSDAAPVELIGGEILTSRRLDHYARCLLARYFSICRGVPVAGIAMILQCHPGTVSRLIGTKLTVDAAPMRPRTISEREMHELRLSERPSIGDTFAHQKLSDA